MDDTVAKAIKAILAVTTVASSNFPSDCVVEIRAVGKNSASVMLPSYVLSAALKQPEAQ